MGSLPSTGSPKVGIPKILFFMCELTYFEANIAALSLVHKQNIQRNVLEARSFGRPICQQYCSDHPEEGD
mgnify:CR=1 FL=1